jgi:NAD+ synthase
MQTGKVIEYIVEWLSGYCEQAGMAGYALGVSGGVDSAVTSALCAMTGKTVYALILPVKSTPSKQHGLSEAHVGWLSGRYPNVVGATQDLSPVFNAFKDSFPAGLQDGLTLANTCARLRMVALYAYATPRRLLVAGTGNKVEDFGVGFFTKYGDGGVDVSPIADLMKSEVYRLGRHLGVLEPILDAPPTDGLWEDNRSDAEQIGADYHELEWAMRFEEQGGKGSVLSTRQENILAIYRERHRANLHKMTPIPVAEIPRELK